MIKIVAVGKIKEKYFKDAISEYVKRLSPYTKLEIIEVLDEKTSENNEGINLLAKENEGKRILSKINDDEYVIALDLHGKDLSSEQLAKKVEEINIYHSSKITFVIAGSLGYSENVLRRANFRWRLSNCTFPHQMVRMLLEEQLYRAYKINNNEPYHK